MKTRLRYSVLKIVSKPEIIHQYLTKMRTDEENWQYSLVTVSFHRLMTQSSLPNRWPYYHLFPNKPISRVSYVPMS